LINDCFVYLSVIGSCLEFARRPTKCGWQNPDHFRDIERAALRIADQVRTNFGSIYPDPQFIMERTSELPIIGS
jgi:hypothetical protein